VTDDDLEIVRGSGNVFRDFGHPNPDLEQARAIVAARIISALDERGLSTRQAQEMTGVGHAEFSRIRNAKLGRFTLDRLIDILGKVDQDIVVTIAVASRRPRGRPEPHAA
jgi:predicted XRE-type DNA-binding protein